jgi:hypothetical protein
LKNSVFDRAAKLQPVSFRRRFFQKKFSKNQRLYSCFSSLMNCSVLRGCKGKTFTRSAINFLEEIFLKTVLAKSPSRTQRTCFAAEAGAKVGSWYDVARVFLKKVSSRALR